MARPQGGKWAQEGSYLKRNPPWNGHSVLSPFRETPTIAQAEANSCLPGSSSQPCTFLAIYPETPSQRLKALAPTSKNSRPSTHILYEQKRVTQFLPSLNLSQLVVIWQLQRDLSFVLPQENFLKLVFFFNYEFLSRIRKNWENKFQR